MTEHGVGERAVIIGAGHAGTTAAIQLRSLGFRGTVDLLSDETHIPYQRPPLSKAWLLGKTSNDAIAFKPLDFYFERGIDLRLGSRVERIERESQVVALADGKRLPYDWLIIATGARARRLQWIPGNDSSVYELRNRSDAELLRRALQPGKRVIIVGAGYIGLEAAASARAVEASVVIVEREDRVLGRVASAPVSEFFQRYHESRGIAFRLGDSITEFYKSASGACTVGFSRGDEAEADLLLVGVGALPNQELAGECGLQCHAGIVVDESARTNDPRIFAIGDCAHRPLPLYQRNGRLESVANALEQARVAAHAICGQATPIHEVPWFWSDQYDLKLQIAGLSFDVGCHVMRGDPKAGKFAVFHLNAANQLQAVEAINSAPEFLAGRKLIALRRNVDPQLLADPDKPIKEIAA